jgi:TolB-like protein/tetratricopeptide (TPR) repeat protein
LREVPAVQGSNVVDQLPSPALCAEEVRAELARILSSPHFQASGKRRAFLRFIVEETLAGRADRLKGYSIAVDVFGRDETFDATADPVVRLEARRLRRDLDSYYVDAGSHDAVRISIPKGTYVPHFEWYLASPPLAAPREAQTVGLNELAANGIPDTTDATPPKKSSHAPARKVIAALAVIVAVIAAVEWVLMVGKETSVSNEAGREPSIVVLPFEAFSSSDEGRYLAKGIRQELIADLMRFPGFRLYTLPAAFERNPSTEPAKLGRDLGVAYVVSGSVNANAEKIHVAAQTIDAKTGRVLWSQTYNRLVVPDALIRVQTELASDIATILGQPYGTVTSDLNVRQYEPAVANMQSYVCVLRAYEYRRSFLREQFDPVLKCLKEAVRRDPDYSDAWAMLGWLHLDAGRIPYVGFNTQDEYHEALQAANEAIRLTPNSILALKVVSAVQHYLGHYDESERLARKALAINPYDPETLAQLGWRLAVRGKFEEGVPILKRAIARTVNPPGWYFHLVAIDLYLKGDYKDMLEVIEHAAPDRSGFTQYLLAIANGALGNREKTREALKHFAEYKPLASDPVGFMRRHGAVDEIVNSLVAGLKKAERVASGNLTQTRLK